MQKGCKVSNGYAIEGDIIAFLGLWGGDGSYTRCPEGTGWLYKVIGFQEYEGKPQIKYRRVIEQNGKLVFYPDSSPLGSWMVFDEALTEIKIVQRKQTFMRKLIRLLVS